MNNIEDFYPLSPMQQGILFHTLSASKFRMYFLQFGCTICGDFHTLEFKNAWQRVIEEYQILRTSFIWEGLKEPVQVVHREVKLPWEELDWRGLESQEQQERLQAFIKADQEQGFELAQVPLIRFTLIQLTEKDYQFIWSYHHLLADAWSASLILKAVFEYYNAFIQGKELNLENPRPYRDYIAWLQQQDLLKAEMFWRQWLKNFTAVTSLRKDQIISSVDSQDGSYNQQFIQLSTATTAKLQSLTQQQQLTLNTLVQGAWALILSCYSGKEDVVFGVICSGRSATLPEIDSMVGLFFNTLPMRVHIEPEKDLVPWLKQLQVKQTEMQQYEFSPLVKIQRWSDVPLGLPLFDTTLNFHNYPLDVALREGQYQNFKLDNYWSFAKVNYPLWVEVFSGQQLLIRITYDSSCFDPEMINGILKQFESILCTMVTQPHIKLDALKAIMNEVNKKQQIAKEEKLKEARLEKFKKLKKQKVS